MPLAKLIRQLKLFAKAWRPQVLSHMRQALFECQQRVGDGLGIRHRDVAPHTVGTCSQACRLAECTPTDGGDFGRVSEPVLKQCCQRRREHLREMAYPGAEL